MIGREDKIIAAARQTSFSAYNLIGDDCACLPLNDTDTWLVTTDTLYENVHFLKKQISPHQLAYKAQAVNLSDLAAMGASFTNPVYAFLNLCLPVDLEDAWLNNFWQGWKNTAEQTNIILAGGDTTRADKNIVINLTLMTACPKANIKQRSAARADDILAVTGTLGESAAGLQILLGSTQTKSHFLVDRHHTPPLRLAEAAWLGQQSAVHGMMDLSDGLARDLPKFCGASNTGCELSFESLPISVALEQFAAQENLRAADFAYTGGEDYELLVSVAPESWSMVKAEFEQRFQSTHLTAIGQLTADPDIKMIYYSLPYSPADYGFDHFKP